MLYRNIILVFTSICLLNISPAFAGAKLSTYQAQQSTAKNTPRKPKHKTTTAIIRPMLLVSPYRFKQQKNNKLVSGFMLDESGQLRYMNAVPIRHSATNKRFIFVRPFNHYSRKAKY